MMLKAYPAIYHDIGLNFRSLQEVLKMGIISGIIELVKFIIDLTKK